eukprot:4502205-Prymnesium_polylepis.1
MEESGEKALLSTTPPLHERQRAADGSGREHHDAMHNPQSQTTHWAGPTGRLPQTLSGTSPDVPSGPWGLP